MNQLQPQEVFKKVSVEEWKQLPAKPYGGTWVVNDEGRPIYIKPITAIVLSESELKREKEEYAKGFAEWMDENCYMTSGIKNLDWFTTKGTVGEKNKYSIKELLSLYNQSLNPQHQ